MKKSRFKVFLEKVRFKYKVSILNENTLAETFNIRLSRLYVFLFICIFISITFIINSILIIKTPIKHFLPGYEEYGLKAEFIHTAITVDSLADEVQMQNEYITVLREIISGNIKGDEIISLDSIALKKREEILNEKSKKEIDFCNNFEKEEQYNLSNVNIPQNQNAFVFFKPTKGIIIRKHDLSQAHYGVDIATGFNENVVSILDGTVIYTGFTVEDAYVISIQHEDGFISIYKNNSSLLKNIGASVKAGEIIAFSGNKNEKTHLHFELWQKGKSLNPEEYIIF